MASEIASMVLAGKSPEGADLNIRVAISVPRQSDDGDWVCSVSMEPLYGRALTTHGIDAFQALFLAMRLSLTLLHDFTLKGGSLSYADDASPDKAFPFEAYRVTYPDEA